MTRQENTGNIFIVHGHDHKFLAEVIEVIKEDYQPIVLQHEAKSGSTALLDAFADYAKKTDFAVILMTPDDIGFSRSRFFAWKYRARQNVIFEAGYFLAYLGHKNVLILRKGKAEIPSDLDGINRIELLDISEKSWRQKLIKEIEAAEIKALLKIDTLEPIPVPFDTTTGERLPISVYKFRVTNDALRRDAVNCSLKLIKLISVDSQVAFIEQLIDRLKWDEDRNPEIKIKPNTSKTLPAFCTRENYPVSIFLYRTVDNLDRLDEIKIGTGEFILEYELSSDNFPTVTKTFKLIFDGTVEFKPYTSE